MANTLQSIWRGLNNAGTSQRANTEVIASAATIAPTKLIVEITGTTDISTITLPYVGFSGVIHFIFTNGAPPDFITGGNIAKSKSPVTLEMVTMVCYNGTWYPQMV